MTQPLAIDLFCGLGGWTEGLLAEGYWVVGFDIERHEYWMPEIEHENVGGMKGTKPFEKRGWSQGVAISLGIEGAAAKPRTRLVRYPAQLVIQDVLTLHGSQFKDAALIVASPPCQEYSYMAMPWSKAKAKAAEYRSGARDVKDLTVLFDACFRIQREACEAAGHHIPMVIENVRGAIPWVGRSRWNYGSFHLWGDVPALMPFSNKRFHKIESPHLWLCDPKRAGGKYAPDYVKGPSISGRRTDPGKGARFTSRDCGEEGIKCGGDWFNADQQSISRLTSSKSPARKAASAMIAKIQTPLSRWVAAAYRPAEKEPQ